MINQTVYVSYDLAIQRRMFRMLMNKVYEQIPVELSYTHDKLWHGLLESTDGYQQLDFPQQVIIERAYKTIYVYRKQVGKVAQVNEYRIESIPKTIDLEAGHTIDIAYAPVQEEKTHTYFVPEDRLQLPLTIRPRKDGDRMTYRGLQGRKKVKDILIDLKIPRSERDKLLVLEDGKGEIIWLIGWKKRFPRLEKNEQAVRITYDETRSKEEK